MCRIFIRNGSLAILPDVCLAVRLPAEVSRPENRYPLPSTSFSMHVLALRPARRPHRPCCTVEVAPLTGPLDGLIGRRVLVLVDDENLRISARELGYRLSLRRLGERLRRQSAECSLHGFFSRDPGDERRCDYYRDRGWVPHPRDVQVFSMPGGEKRHANSDVHLALEREEAERPRCFAAQDEEEPVDED
jgi:hypothetical protein